MGSIRTFVLFGSAPSGLIAEIEVAVPPAQIVVPFIGSTVVLYAPSVEVSGGGDTGGDLELEGDASGALELEGDASGNLELEGT